MIDLSRRGHRRRRTARSCPSSPATATPSPARPAPPRRPSVLRALGAEPVVVDGARPRRRARRRRAPRAPDAIVHQMTSLGGSSTCGTSSAPSRATNRLRTEGTDHLLAAARAAGVERFVAQSFAAWPYARAGGPVKTEDDPLDPDPPTQLRDDARGHPPRSRRRGRPTGRRHRAALRRLLRPRHRLAPGGDQSSCVRKRAVPARRRRRRRVVVRAHRRRRGGTLAALECGRPGGIYNIFDDDPAPAREWLPALAAAIGAPPPRHLPRWVGRLFGAHVVTMMTEIRGASNEPRSASSAGSPRGRAGARASLPSCASARRPCVRPGRRGRAAAT